MHNHESPTPSVLYTWGEFTTNALYHLSEFALPVYLIAGLVMMIFAPWAKLNEAWWSGVYRRSFIIYAVCKIIQIGVPWCLGAIEVFARMGQ